MVDVTFDEVAQLAERLSPEEQRALIVYLEERAQQRQLTVNEWMSLFDALMIDVGAWPEDDALKRTDWYDDER